MKVIATSDAAMAASTRTGTISHGKGMVARTGFEPVISALRGRCPRPLDERATVSAKWWLGIEDSNLGLQIQSLSSYH